MADEDSKKKGYDPYERNPTVLMRGMFKDTNEEFQPEGTYRFALNTILKSEDGEKGALISEEGNRLCGDLGSITATVIGNCLIPDGRVVLFVAYTPYTVGLINYPAHGAIVLQNEDCTIDVLIRSECLDFLPTDVIKCQFKIQNGCDIYLYFTDRRTEYKSINISKLSEYVIDGFGDPNIPVANQFGWDCGLFKFNPEYNIPNIQLEQVQNSGRLRIGAYFVALRYLDLSLNGTNWTPSTGPITITLPTGETNALDISGGIVTPDLIVDGTLVTNKAIKLSIKELDTRYDYFQLAILEFTQGTDTNNLTFKSTPYQINSSEREVLITELSPQRGWISESNSNINVPSTYIDIVRAHAQAENRLIVGNLKEVTADWSVFQKAATNIKSLYFTYKETLNSNTESCSTAIINQSETDGFAGREFNRSEFLFDYKTYMRDEVYAFAIVYVFKNGKESPAFHIPGRPAIGLTDDITNDGKYTVTDIVSGFGLGTAGDFNTDIGRARWYGDYTDTWGFANNMYDNYNVPDGQGWDRTVYSYSEPALKPEYLFATLNGLDSSFQNTLIDKSQNILNKGYCVGNEAVERWQFVNTSIKFNSQNGLDLYDPSFDAIANLQIAINATKTPVTIQSAGLCAYYETNTQYPKGLDCDGEPVYPWSGDGDEKIMHRIRHHKMPDSRKEPIFKGISFDGVNTLMEIYPLGMFFYNIEVPAEYEDEIQGYYIVRSDRSGNKTIIDKGWLNVCDVTYGLQQNSGGTSFETVELNGEPLLGEPFAPPYVIQQNPFFMTPTDKYGSWEPRRSQSGNTSAQNGRKQMHVTGANYIEFFSPKASINEPVNLQGSYYKLENTIITAAPVLQTVERLTENDDDWDVINDICNVPNAWEGMESFRVFSFVEAYDIRLPRMFNFREGRDFYLLHNVPILNSEYTLYNLDNFAVNRMTLNNENHRQTIMLSRLYKDYLGIIAVDPMNLNIATVFKPLAYYYGSETVFPSLFIRDRNNCPDILNPATFLNSPQTSTVTRTPIDTEYLVRRNDGVVSSRINNLAQCPDYCTSVGAHFYYAALKSNIQPYERLEDIIYLKANSNIQNDFDISHAITTNGDCFITKQRLFKSFQKSTVPSPEDNDDNNGKLMGTVIQGYVESEINTHFRHKENTDVYKAIPFDDIVSAQRTNVLDVHNSEESLVDLIEHLYRYNLDYSADNRNRQYFSLNDNHEFCSDCQESFPVTMKYSEPSLSTQVNDNYKTFLSASVQELPADTGQITNMFLKEQNLFVQTESNLYRLTLAQQELDTGTDRVQIGSGSILTAKPQRMFDNAEGFGRGGTEFEHSATFCDDRYIWVDNKSRRIYGLSKGIEEISAKGMSMWFRKNLTLEMREQWKSITGTDYPYLNTSTTESIGFIGTFDPYYNRYVLHKKDYVLSGAVTSILSEDLGSGYVAGRYYWNSTGLFRAFDEDTLVRVDLEKDINVINNSFTVSYSLDEEGAWSSFHSYRPNHMFYNNYTFFTSVNNTTADRSKYTWKHGERNFQNYYGIKFDMIYDYVAKGPETVYSKHFETIDLNGNVYAYDTTGENWYEKFFNCFDRVCVYNNTQSSGMFNVVVSNELPYFEVTNDPYTSRILSVHRDRDNWRLNSLRDYSNNVLGSTASVLSKNWSLAAYSDIFRAQPNTGYLDYIPNPSYLNLTKSPYELQRFKDKFLNVRIFFKPSEDYKIVINTISNLKQTLI